MVKIFLENIFCNDYSYTYNSPQIGVVKLILNVRLLLHNLFLIIQYLHFEYVYQLSFILWRDIAYASTFFYSDHPFVSWDLVLDFLVWDRINGVVSDKDWKHTGDDTETKHGCLSSHCHVHIMLFLILATWVGWHYTDINWGSTTPHYIRNTTMINDISVAENMISKHFHDTDDFAVSCSNKTIIRTLKLYRKS